MKPDHGLGILFEFAQECLEFGGQDFGLRDRLAGPGAGSEFDRYGGRVGCGDDLYIDVAAAQADIAAGKAGSREMARDLLRVVDDLSQWRDAAKLILARDRFAIRRNWCRRCALRRGGNVGRPHCLASAAGSGV